MTAAERMKRMRARRKSGLSVKDDHRKARTQYYIDSGLSEHMRLAGILPVAERAKFANCSERSMYYVRAFARHSLIEWDNDLVNGKYGRVGVSFLADVCRYGDARAQALIQQIIIREGPRAARDSWDKIKFEAGLPNKHMLKQTKMVERRRG